MSVIALRASAVGDVTAAPVVAGTATFTVALPAGTQATDVVLICLAVAIGSGAIVPTCDTPSGWTLVNTAGTESGVKNMAGYAFWALGNVAGLTFTCHATNWVGWVISSWTGVDNTTPIDVAGTAAANISSGTITAASFNIVTTGAAYLIGVADWSFGVLSATGFTKIVNAASPVNQDFSFLYELGVASGATAAVMVSDSAGASGNVLTITPFALRPAGAVVVASLQKGSALSLGLHLGF